MGTPAGSESCLFYWPPVNLLKCGHELRIIVLDFKRLEFKLLGRCERGFAKKLKDDYSLFSWYMWAIFVELKWRRKGNPA
jgi:hypothetical protein